MTDYLTRFTVVRRMYEWRGWTIYWFVDEGRCELYDPQHEIVASEEDLKGVISGAEACERLAMQAIDRDAEGE
jgi:hypothetical protein